MSSPPLRAVDTSLPAPTDSPSEADADIGTPVSVRIRERIKLAQRRFHANDNIAEFIEPGELEALLDEVQGKMEGVLSSLVIDTDSDHNTQDTARRVAKMYLQEIFKGRYLNAPTGHRVPQRRAPQRVDDRRAHHRAQRLLTPPVPHHRPGVDWRDAQ
jgi:GTP cyclohydrolase I